MQVLAFNWRVIHCPAVRTKIKRRLKEAVRLLITRSVAAEESRRGPKLVVFCVEDTGVDNSKWITPGELLFHAPTFYPSFSFLGGFVEWVLASHADWAYVVFPTSEMFCMSLRNYLGFFMDAFPMLRVF
jgi:hypothetical protein